MECLRNAKDKLSSLFSITPQAAKVGNAISDGVAAPRMMRCGSNNN